MNHKLFDYTTEETFADWHNAHWIWQSGNGPVNSWMCFRKRIYIDKEPSDISTAVVKIAVDTKYWMWINGSMVVYEGELYRGPTYDATYYDEVDIKEYLIHGTNTIAILVWYLGEHDMTGYLGEDGVWYEGG